MYKLIKLYRIRRNLGNKIRRICRSKKVRFKTFLGEGSRISNRYIETSKEINSLEKENSSSNKRAKDLLKQAQMFREKAVQFKNKLEAAKEELSKREKRISILLTEKGNLLRRMETHLELLRVPREVIEEVLNGPPPPPPPPPPRSFYIDINDSPSENGDNISYFRYFIGYMMFLFWGPCILMMNINSYAYADCLEFPKQSLGSKVGIILFGLYYLLRNLFNQIPLGPSLKKIGTYFLVLNAIVVPFGLNAFVLSPMLWDDDLYPEAVFGRVICRIITSIYICSSVVALPQSIRLIKNTFDNNFARLFLFIIGLLLPIILTTVYAWGPLRYMSDRDGFNEKTLNFNIWVSPLKRLWFRNHWNDTQLDSFLKLI